jgi:hypothetical protein
MEKEILIQELEKIKNYYFDKEDYVSYNQVGRAIDVAEDYYSDMNFKTESKKHMKKNLLSEEIKRMQELSGIQNEYIIPSDFGNEEPKEENPHMKNLDLAVSDIKQIINDINLKKQDLKDEELIYLSKELQHYISEMNHLVDTIQKP